MILLIAFLLVQEPSVLCMSINKRPVPIDPSGATVHLKCCPPAQHVFNTRKPLDKKGALVCVGDERET